MAASVAWRMNMHVVHGELRKAPFIKQLAESTMYALELSEMIKDYKTGDKTYTNYKAILFAKSDAHIAHYNNTLVEGNFIVLTSDKLKIERSECGQYIKLFMDNARLEGSGYIQPQAPQQQQQSGYQKQAQQATQQAQQKGQQQAQQQKPAQQQAKAPDLDDGSWDDDIPF